MNNISNFISALEVVSHTKDDAEKDICDNLNRLFSDPNFSLYDYILAEKELITKYKNQKSDNTLIRVIHLILASFTHKFKGGKFTYETYLCI